MLHTAAFLARAQFMPCNGVGTIYSLRRYILSSA
jgi:hypothetical protein